ncbi:hypothetical protein ASD08_13585 [Streptomyces sp. Root369]|nr:hypothetical protein ASD08_13585 [Streptomyces sp. Root369]
MLETLPGFSIARTAGLISSSFAAAPCREIEVWVAYLELSVIFLPITCARSRNRSALCPSQWARTCSTAASRLSLIPPGPTRSWLRDSQAFATLVTVPGSASRTMSFIWSMS